MTDAALHAEEEVRLAALYDLEILDTPREPLWDRIAETAATICEAPISLVTLIDRDRQWFKARLGIAVPETARALSLCAHTILQDGLFVVPDARADHRFAKNPLVTDTPNIRFYAGSPLRAPSGHPVGAVCVADHEPRELTSAQSRALELLAAQAADLLVIREAAQAIHRLVAHDRARSRQGFINDVAHHLQTPLTPAILQIDVLRHKLKDDPELLRHADAVERSLVRLRRHIEESVGPLIEPSHTNTLRGLHGRVGARDPDTR